ncbi:MAG TPA: hypothetical protein VGB22_10325 [candidate division Zixibacteria bacterium]|jgi:cell division septal protein FtsQ
MVDESGTAAAPIEPVTSVPPRRRRWRRVTLLIVDTVILTAVAVLWRYPVWKVQALVYEGTPVWREATLSLITIDADSNFVRLPLADMREALSRHFGDLATVGLRLQLPGTLAIRVTPTQAALWLDAATGISPSGQVLISPVGESAEAPVWTGPMARRGSGLRSRARVAAAVWNELMETEQRYSRIASEWRFTEETGWEIIAADGSSRIILGRTAIRPRARAAAGLLSRETDALPYPCEIDTRFSGQLVVRALEVRQECISQLTDGS